MSVETFGVPEMGEPVPVPPEEPPVPEPTDPTVHFLIEESFRFDPADPEKDLTPKTACGLVSDGSILVSTVIEQVGCTDCRPVEPESAPVEEVAVSHEMTAGALSQPVPADPVEVTSDGEPVVEGGE